MEAAADLARTRSATTERPDTRRYRSDSSSSSIGSPMFSPRLATAAPPDSRTTNLRRIPSRTAREDRPTGGSLGRLKSNARPPLLPVTERKGHDDGKTEARFRKDAENDRADITPDGGSASRGGRKFTVANVGNNGRIYLRPTIRPANQRYPQPNFVFPMTPPATATLDFTPTTATRKEADATDPDRLLQGSQLAVSQPPTSDTASMRLAYEGRISARHRRALSDSTVPEPNVACDTDDAGVFKVVITQPGDDQRPNTVGVEQNDGPFLDISIPSWKIGSPRFTPLGTALLRGSSAGAPTEDIRSTVASPRAETPQSDLNKPKKPNPISIPRIRLPQVGAEPSPVLFSPVKLAPIRSTYLSTHLVIEPAMFDDLTFKPACDDRSIVRYSAATSAVTAATPPRLVAEITSPSFLDYELLSDFFLTFRAFLECDDLLKMLIARLRWSLRRTDEAGMVVRVRTFVALRHWILNYFVDDFVVDYHLRIVFCNLLNDLVDELSQDPGAGKVQVKILGELKKCWRRICSQYWDGPEFDSSLGPEAPIGPGGIAGHRRASLDPGFWEQDDEPPQLDAIFGLPADAFPEAVRSSFAMEVSRAGRIDSVALQDTKPATSALQQGHLRRMPLSVSSIDVISCSFPTKNMLFPQPPTEIPPAAHPVDPTSFSTAHNDPVATTPRALTGKRVRPQQSQHKRNGSLTDSLRDHGPATAPAADKQMAYRDTELLMSIPYAGSLVRGAMFPPAQAFVEIPAPNSAGAPRQTTMFNTHPLETQKVKVPASAMSSQGMRRLLSSVRRALSSKGTSISPAQGHFLNISPIGPRGATTNRLPGTAIVPQARPRLNGTRPSVRIDLLGAEVAEDFKKAIREDAAAEAASFGRAILEGLEDDDDDSDNWASGGEPGHTSGHLNTPLQPQSSGSILRPYSDTAISTGSQSIVIVDDTLPAEGPVMTGALPVSSNHSIEAFAETFMYTGGADPTPPNTPPSQTMGTPRKSSYILRHPLTRQVNSEEILPAHAPVIEPEHTTRSSEDTTRPSTDMLRPSVEFMRQSSRPPLSGVWGHFRQRSSRSYQSVNSFGRRRYASFTSGIAPQLTIRSFATSTYSEASVDDAPVTQPLRMLRRRPGGDLRAATNIGELHPLRRSRSVGSLTTYSESVRSSYIRSPGQDSSGFIDVVTSEYSHERAAAFSLGAITEQHPKKISLFSTHSSKPVMRPSFEAEAQKLAQIPDDVGDDGGVEAALLKLEGKFDKRAFKLSMEPTNLRLPSLGAVAEHGVVTSGEKREHRQLHINDDTHLSQMVAHKLESGEAVGDVTDSEADTELTPKQPSTFLEVTSSSPLRPDSGIRSFLSGESYSSIPLLDRGLTDEARSNAPTRQWAGMSVLLDSAAGTPTGAQSPSLWEHMSFDFVNKTDSLDMITPGETQPQPQSQPEPEALMSSPSFLDDDSDAASDLSSELSVELVAEQEHGEMKIRKRPGTIISGLPVHPLGEPSTTEWGRKPQPLAGNPPSPPITMIQALQMSPETARGSQPHRQWASAAKPLPLPPTPDATPTTAAPEHGFDSPRTMAMAKEARADAGRMSLAPKFNAHLPFILAFDSEILAQQFTLIEKDALNEIDWKELIEMRWKNAENIDARSWVDFLRNSEARGVEVVIARFNIMVKWCVSEIVLTQDLEERARCVIKFVHIAAHCRRFRNFATMSQIAIALTSQEVSRLTRTWAMVPANDLTTLRDLEMLVSPTRNFYTLRAEMEGGGIASADTGCIPFVGIYTHDLLFNAQRPSEIASSPTTAPLVNFERCRIAAGVVKTLLRLLEASTLYRFQPIEGITERCLWMGALSDDEIRRLSDSLET
ncbi:guanine nucleotide exchange factor LTE1 [Gaeumannomyces tritici R3-111a-1]|uniref:Guanine nucleotide exchange factor LTE1 n=1 Tax=Gaeumannomyces tritici (strain R3-111a-1) TaxID=644352 RepID=J3PCD6_GAET3|nr:guanine nucleotide exchange factor LTE1 [Gaeumannomyces tritici R3-111a-1]EJT71906.1 guanine nucleotide exchange factor LTE1 [Gaeumannomyces tritici R3-111a-1]